MSVTKLPSGRWRAQVFDPSSGKNVSVSTLLGGSGTFRTKSEAKTARERARERLKARHGDKGVTVAVFAERWTTDPLFSRPKESTNIFNRERIKHFVERYGHVLMTAVDDDVVSEWLTGGLRVGTVPSLRAMFNDAASAKGGRLIERNPFAGLGLRKTQGNRHRQPPPEEQMWSLVGHARRLTPPSFAAWLEVACFTAMRPGELDALSWRQIDFDAGTIMVDVQWNVKTRSFTEPKYGPYTIALVKHARERLLARSRDARFVFTTLRGTHYTPSSRNHHWNRVRSAAGLGGMTLYLATRHYFGYYALNVLELEPSVIAVQLGHRDGGKLVEELYGHRDHRKSLAKIREAFERATESKSAASATRVRAADAPRRERRTRKRRVPVVVSPARRVEEERASIGSTIAESGPTTKPQ
jgi:integrase